MVADAPARAKMDLRADGWPVRDQVRAADPLGWAALAGRAPRRLAAGRGRPSPCPGPAAPLIFADPQATDAEAIASAVTHVVSADPSLAIPGYAVEREFGGMRILRRQAGVPAVRLWQDHAPTITGVDWTASGRSP